MEKDNGGPAFPGAIDHGASGIEAFTGMTLRDYFAAKVLQGMWAAENVRGSAEELAQGAYAAADAMLAEREK